MPVRWGVVVSEVREDLARPVLAVSVRTDGHVLLHGAPGAVGRAFEPLLMALRKVTGALVVEDLVQGGDWMGAKADGGEVKGSTVKGQEGGAGLGGDSKQRTGVSALPSMPAELKGGAA